MSSENESQKPLSAVEKIKAESRFLRGTLVEDISDESTGGISGDNAQLTKFHGLYLQDDRDQRIERRKQKLERAFSFMMRVRVPGGVCTPAQYLAIDEMAGRFANGTVRLTTRQAFQLHGLLKGNVKPVIQNIVKAGMDSIAACGDVNRNVMCNPLPQASAIHEETYETARAISRHLTPRSRAYYEVWLDEEKVAGGEPEDEPIYGKTYLPRKFKIGIAVPPSNDVDIYSQDLGFIAIVEGGKLAGYNVVAGGGLGKTHGKAETFPRLADPIGFCTPEQVVSVAEAVVTTQRDYGDRTDRKHARLKYTIADRGVDWFRGEVEKRTGLKFEESRPVTFDGQSDRYGWHRDTQGNWYFILFVLSGRIRDTEGATLRSAVREIAQVHEGDFRLTANQNLMIAGVSEKKKPEIEAILEKHNVHNANRQTALRLNAMACPALPTCGLALAEAERFLPEFIERLETVVEEAGLRDDAITVRITGCPNGCARPYLAEIGLVGKAPGKYNLYLGAGFDGTRLNEEVGVAMTPDEILDTVGPLIRRYAKEREDGERFGDFCRRTGAVEPVAPAGAPA